MIAWTVYLDILVLTHLRTAPVHGYELKRKIAATTMFALNNNTLYPALRRFEEAGAVRKTAVQQEGRPPRHIYELTDIGHELLHDMLADLPRELAGNDEEFLTRVGMFDDLTPGERRGVLTTRDQALSARIEHLKDLAARAEASSQNRQWGSLVTAELIGRALRERTWIDGLMRLIEESP
jgi:DNA-binding PadR family transcriptional regulator